MSEQFTLQERFRQSPAINFDKRPSRPLAVVVYHVDQQFLACPAFAGDQHGSLRRGHFGDSVIDGAHLGRSSQRMAQAVMRAKFTS